MATTNEATTNAYSQSTIAEGAINYATYSTTFQAVTESRSLLLSRSSATGFGSDEVVEYVDTSEKVVEAPDVKESTLDLEAAHSVGFNDEKDDKPSEEAVFKDDDEIVFERKEKTIWKPPDAED
jgi:hypothetical protein